MSRRLLLALCLITQLVPPATAAPKHGKGAPAEDPQEQLAKQYYDHALKLFNLGKFDDALDEFQKAFEAKPIPGILFNIGQTQRNLGDFDGAIFSFKRFLQLEPASERRDQVEQLIEDLQDQSERQKAKDLDLVPPKRTPDEGAHVTGPAPPPEGKPVYKKWWFWTGVAVVVGGGAGIYAVTRSGTPSGPDTDLGTVKLPP